ncbi:MAG: (d)CMP kinase [Crocinitomicaceae bacterium]
MKKIKIAIDGFSSCGKSTIAKELAKKLHYTYVDTGAMYRAATLYFMRSNIEPNDPQLLHELDKMDIAFQKIEGEVLPVVHLNGENVENEIRTLEVSNQVSHYSKIKQLREKLVALQQKIGAKGGVVLDGRDIGSVVFPNAELKLFMTASPEIRAKRRFEELIAKGEDVDFQSILDNVESRDKEDTSRKESPLVQVEDAIVLDNSHLSREQQLDFVMDLVQKKLK